MEPRPKEINQCARPYGLINTEQENCVNLQCKAILSCEDASLTPNHMLGLNICNFLRSFIVFSNIFAIF